MVTKQWTIRKKDLEELQMKLIDIIDAPSLNAKSLMGNLSDIYEIEIDYLNIL